MTDSLRISDHLFDDAEALVERIEHACHVETNEQLIYDQITAEILSVTGATNAVLWIHDQAGKQTLSRSGILVSAGADGDSTVQLPEATADDSAAAGAVAKWGDRLRLETTDQLGPGIVIGLTLQFDKPVDGSLSRALCELSEAILALACGVYLRRRFVAFNHDAVQQSHRDQVLLDLNAGTDLLESLECIASTVATEVNFDRVSIMQMRRGRPRMLVSSTQPRVDRRARQVRLLETLIGRVIGRTERFRYVVGDPDQSDKASEPAVAAAIDQYLSDSASRELVIEAIFAEQTDTHRGEKIAVMVLERFRVEHAATGATGFDRLRNPAFAAVRRAFQRSQIGWPTIMNRLAAGGMRKRVLTVIVAAVLIVAALALVPAKFAIPVEGRLLTTKHHRIYAPANGTVVDLRVDNGQEVDEGQLLLRIRSAELDQKQRQIEGALATAKSKLAVVVASRSRDRNSQSGTTGNTFASSDEQVLKTEVEGLQAQLDLLSKQQAELIMVSPIQGVVDRWDLQQSLTGRPVVQGQFLIDVVSDVDGWMAELDVPDHESQYVIDAHADQPCDVTFRLRSDPEQRFRGALDRISPVTQFDSTGAPVVLASVRFSAGDQHLRFGATVIADIDCGTRPLGFIWCRSLIEWWRQSGWF